jgi:hypothetical protein
MEGPGISYEEHDIHHTSQSGVENGRGSQGDAPDNENDDEDYENKGDVPNDLPEIPMPRGPGGAKKHTPGRGHDTKSRPQTKKRDAERRVKKAQAEKNRLNALQDKWNSLSDEQRKLIGGWDQFVKDQTKKL